MRPKNRERIDFLKAVELPWFGWLKRTTPFGYDRISLRNQSEIGTNSFWWTKNIEIRFKAKNKKSLRMCNILSIINNVNFLAKYRAVFNFCIICCVSDAIILHFGMERNTPWANPIQSKREHIFSIVNGRWRVRWRCATEKHRCLLFVFFLLHLE